MDKNSNNSDESMEDILDEQAMFEMDEDGGMLFNLLMEQDSEIIENKSSIFITRVNTDEVAMKDCDYCKPANMTRVFKSDEMYHMGGFTTGKFRIDDFE
jgi:hypothetical protein